jgi:hypothetical protein
MTDATFDFKDELRKFRFWAIDNNAGVLVLGCIVVVMNLLVSQPVRGFWRAQALHNADRIAWQDTLTG